MDFHLVPIFLFGSPVSGVPEAAATFGDSLGLTGLNTELYLRLRFITAKGHTVGSPREKDAGGVRRNLCTGF